MKNETKDPIGDLGARTGLLARVGVSVALAVLGASGCAPAMEMAGWDRQDARAVAAGLSAAGDVYAAPVVRPVEVECVTRHDYFGRVVTRCVAR